MLVLKANISHFHQATMVKCEIFAYKIDNYRTWLILNCWITVYITVQSYSQFHTFEAFSPGAYLNFGNLFIQLVIMFIQPCLLIESYSMSPKCLELRTDNKTSRISNMYVHENNTWMNDLWHMTLPAPPSSLRKLHSDRFKIVVWRKWDLSLGSLSYSVPSICVPTAMGLNCHTESACRCIP